MSTTPSATPNAPPPAAAAAVAAGPAAAAVAQSGQDYQVMPDKEAPQGTVRVTLPTGVAMDVPYTHDPHHRPIDYLLKKPYDSADMKINSHQRESASTMDPTGRNFTYVMQGGARMIYTTALRFAVIRLISSMSAAADAVAAAKLEVDLSKIFEGSTITVKWRGKPVFIRNRSQKDIDAAKGDDNALMRDPMSDAMRVKKPQWLVVIGICTHLGCVPLPNAGNYNGWFCPCHGSHYDTSGRIRLGPAPLNLPVPEYSFLNEKTLVLG